MSLFKKKFKVRVKHYWKGMYAVQYANYYVIPIYHEILTWYSYSFGSDLSSWGVELFTVEEAENFAAKIKSYHDIIRYYEPLKKEEKEYYEKEKEWYKLVAPYSIKKIK